MKVALVTPYYHQQRGNTVTVRRISEGLRQLGISTEIVSIEENRFPPLPPADLVHGFNAYQFYRYWEKRGDASYPYVVTLTGTDLNHALLQEETKKAVIQSLSGARAIHVFNPKARKLLGQQAPDLEQKTFLIPQGVVEFASGPCQAEQEEGCFLFLLPAGIRRVKNVPATIRMLSSLYERDQRIRLWIVGPVLEETEGNKVRELVRQHPWVRYLGSVPFTEMGEIYRCADVVLNTSLSEGQSSAILEAMAMGIPVVASDIPGNRDILDHGKTGFLYGEPSQFLQIASRLMENEALRNEVGASAKNYVRNHHSAAKETRELAAIYLHILQQETE